MTQQQGARFKVCPDCGETKALAAFGIDRSRSSGYHHRCKACQQIIDRRWVRVRPDEAGRMRAFHATNPGKRHAYQQRWREHHPEQLKEQRREQKQRRRERAKAAKAAEEPT
jgi:hypothetical protein